MLNFEDGYVSGFNTDVQNYFNALINNSEITEDMEQKFRASVKALGYRVYERYKKHFKGKKYENTGETPAFDKLANQ